MNSLEHVLIPEYEEQIRDVSMKMEENERSNLTRLMKVKDTILETEIRERRARLYAREHGKNSSENPQAYSVYQASQRDDEASSEDE